MIVVAQCLIPGDRLVESRRLVRLLIINGFSSQMTAGAGRNDLAVDDIDIPAKFIVLRGVDSVTQRDTEVQWILLMQGVDGLDCGIEHMRGIEHNP